MIEEFFFQEWRLSLFSYWHIGDFILPFIILGGIIVLWNIYKRYKNTKISPKNPLSTQLSRSNNFFTPKPSNTPDINAQNFEIEALYSLQYNLYIHTGNREIFSMTAEEISKISHSQKIKGVYNILEKSIFSEIPLDTSDRNMVLSFLTTPIK